MVFAASSSEHGLGLDMLHMIMSNLAGAGVMSLCISRNLRVLPPAPVRERCTYVRYRYDFLHVQVSCYI